MERSSHTFLFADRVGFTALGGEVLVSEAALKAAGELPKVESGMAAKVA